MHYASGAGRMAVEVLLAAGSDVNADGDGGATPLHEAIVPGGMSQLSKLSAQGGANCSARDHTGRRPADLLSDTLVGLRGQRLRGRGGR